MSRGSDKKVKNIDNDELNQPADEFRDVRGTPVHVGTVDDSKLQKYDTRSKVEE